MNLARWIEDPQEQSEDFHYRCWTEAERDAHARMVAEDLAHDRAEADGIPIHEAFEIEYRAVYGMHPVTIILWQVAA